jgi:uncharacterized protein YjcR
MANTIVDIELSGKTHLKTEDLHAWVNTYAWTATDETTGAEDKKQEGDTEASELDDDFEADS